MDSFRVFGTWPTALLAAHRKKVKIEGPVCDSSQVIGWHLKNMNNETDTITPPIHISSFAFNSSILWDSERWGRTSSVQDTSQVNIIILYVMSVQYCLRNISYLTCLSNCPILSFTFYRNFYNLNITARKFLCKL